MTFECTSRNSAAGVICATVVPGVGSMSDTEHHEEGAEALAPATVVLEPKLVRMSLRPPPRFAAGGDLDLWLTRFRMHARQASIPEDQWVKELLSLLEDEPFRVVSRQGLESSTNYGAVCECLRQHFAPTGSEIEWQFKLQGRVQKPGESLWEFAGALRSITDKAYPRWPGEQRNELLRNQFIQGVRSSSIQLRLMKDIPATLDDVLKTASQQETVETAQKRLLREHQHVEAVTLTEEPTADPPQSAAASATPTASGTKPISRRDELIDTLSRQVKELSEQLSRLQAGQGPQSAGRRDFTCWESGRRGHMKRNCPQLRSTGRDRRPESNLRRRRPLN